MPYKQRTLLRSPLPQHDTYILLPKTRFFRCSNKPYSTVPTSMESELAITIISHIFWSCGWPRERTLLAGIIASLLIRCRWLISFSLYNSCELWEPKSLVYVFTVVLPYNSTPKFIIGKVRKALYKPKMKDPLFD
jgi:hypothetical protein